MEKLIISESLSDVNFSMDKLKQIYTGLQYPNTLLKKPCSRYGILEEMGYNRVINQFNCKIYLQVRIVTVLEVTFGQGHTLVTLCLIKNIT